MSTEKLLHDIPFVIDAARRQSETKPVEVYYCMIAAPSGEPKSLLSRLTAEQQQALSEWADEQPRGNGGVDLMGWPGWVGVVMSGRALVQDEMHSLMSRTEFKVETDAAMPRVRYLSLKNI